MNSTFSSSSEACSTHVPSPSALLKQMDQVSVLGFRFYLKGLAWQCMGYLTTVIPIHEQYILLLFRSLQDACCVALCFTQTNRSSVNSKGLAWQCLGYWSLVVPIDARYILLLFGSLQDAYCAAFFFTQTNGSSASAQLSAILKRIGLAVHGVLVSCGSN
jgi:hypothetical protein